MAHDQFSPSKRHQFGHCPGSIREQAKYPEGPSGPAAVDGTHTHTLLEHCIKGNLISPRNMVGITLEDHEGQFVVDAERAERVQVAIEYIRKRVEAHGGMCEVLSETRVEPEFLIGRKGAGGTVDVQIIGGGVLELIDYKDGIQPTDAKDQLEQYAVGALAKYRIPINLEYPVHTVRMTVVQPKLVMKGLFPINVREVPVKYILDDVVGKLAAELANASAPDAPLIPGELQCKWCRAKGGCAALANKVMSEVNVMFTPTTSPMDMAQQSANKDPATMDADQIRQILEAAPLLRQMLESVEDEAKRRLEAGQTIPGLKLVHGRGSRVWAFGEDEMAEKLIQMGIPKAAIYETKLVTPAKAEKLSWEKRDGTKKQLSKKQLDRLNEYITKMAGKLTVAPESDSRPAVTVDAAPLFSAVKSEPELPAWLR